MFVAFLEIFSSLRGDGFFGRGQKAVFELTLRKDFCQLHHLPQDETAFMNHNF